MVQKSSQVLHKAQLNLRGEDQLNLPSVLDALQRHIRVAECGVFGYISVDDEVVVLIKPVTLSPTITQVETYSINLNVLI